MACETATDDAQAQGGLAARVPDLLNNDPYFVLKCRDRTYIIYKCFMSTSPHVERKYGAVYKGFREEDVEIVDLSEEDPIAVWAAASWYQGINYNRRGSGSRPRFAKPASQDPALLQHAKVYLLADRHGMDVLKEEALEAYAKACPSLTPGRPADDLYRSLEEMYGAGRLEGTKELRRAAVRAIMGDPRRIKEERFSALLEGIPGLAVDLLRAAASEGGAERAARQQTSWERFWNRFTRRGRARNYLVKHPPPPR